MSTRHLEFLFRPRTIVVIGPLHALPGDNDVAAVLLRNLAAAGFTGQVMRIDAAVARNGQDAQDITPYQDALAQLPVAPDLALIAPGVEALAQLIDLLGQRGTRAAILFAARGTCRSGKEAALPMAAILAAARPHRLRVLGPGSVGLIVPALGLHASIMPMPEPVNVPLPAALQGKLAFVSQSGALASAVLDWAGQRGIRFSKFVTIGAGEDVDIADLLDFFARDPNTQAILLHVEQFGRARKFLSAARAAARGKPVVILKAGRAPEAASATASHSGVLTGMDDAADAAIRRAGMLRVHSIMDLFGAAQILANAQHASSGRLIIVSNGTGPGLLAADALLTAGGELATLPDAVAEALQPLMAGRHGNPVSLGFEATPADYAAAVQVLLSGARTDAGSDAGIGSTRGNGNDDGAGNHAARNIDSGRDDAILVIHAPTGHAQASAVAAAIVPALAGSGRTVLSCWLGGSAASLARRASTAGGIPAYGTPEDAVGAFLQMVEYRRNQALLMQVPPSIRCDAAPQHETARHLIDTALAAGRTSLAEPEAKALLAAYGIPVVRTVFAPGIEEAVAAAETIGFPVALKVVAHGILHKSDIGGVVLDLENSAAVAEAGRAMQARLARRMPNAAIDGFSVQAMARRVAGLELIIGAATDPVFGPVILFGQGGVAVEVMDDKAIGLPPLNMVLARDMVSRTRVARLLAGYRNLPAADIDAICHTLVQVAYLVSDLAEVVEVDINPLLADASGVVALDAHIRLARPAVAATGAMAHSSAGAAPSGLQRLAIRPYPQELEQWIDWQGTRVLLRPIRPEDGKAHLRFVHALQPDDVRYRMFVAMRQLPPAQLARFTQIDYDREMAFIATRPQADGTGSAGSTGSTGSNSGGGDASLPWETLGVARVVIDAATNEAEFAIIVRSDLKGHGLGTLLMQRLIDYCRSRGIDAIVGEALSDNRGLRRLVRRLGFTIDPFGEQGTRGLRLALHETPLGHLDQESESP